jgi:hypothetical protein
MHLSGRLVATASAVVALLAMTTTATAASPLSNFGNVTCHGGSFGSPTILKNGTYQSLHIVGGFCMVPTGGNVTVKGQVTVEDHAGLNTLTQSTFNVGGNVVALDDAIVGLGCSDEVGCKHLTNDHIGGSLHSYGARAMIVQQEMITGDATIFTGGGSMDCSLTVLAGGPYFDTIEDSSVGGSVTVKGVHSCWFGLFRDHVGGNVTVSGNRMGDPDANEIATNTIGGNLACYNNRPHAQVGDSEGSANVVAGKKLGECAHL